MILFIQSSIIIVCNYIQCKPVACAKGGMGVRGIMLILI